MRFFRTSPDEIVIVDGKASILVMARDGAVELELTFSTYVCGTDCEKAGTIFWHHCEECPKEIFPR